MRLFLNILVSFVSTLLISCDREIDTKELPGKYVHYLHTSCDTNEVIFIYNDSTYKYLLYYEGKHEYTGKWKLAKGFLGEQEIIFDKFRNTSGYWPARVEREGENGLKIIYSTDADVHYKKTDN